MTRNQLGEHLFNPGKKMMVGWKLVEKETEREGCLH